MESPAAHNKVTLLFKCYACFVRYKKRYVVNWAIFILYLKGITMKENKDNLYLFIFFSCFAFIIGLAIYLAIKHPFLVLLLFILF